MRYKGENSLKFSCDPDKNVTIILGDNTFGKTTIAQAFRWALYGEIKKTNYVEDIKDIVLLNKDVIASMNINSYGKVLVEVIIEDGDTVYEFIRSQTFRKNNNDPGDLTVKPLAKPSLSMIETINGKKGDVISDEGSADKRYPSGYVQNKINSMLPEKLSDYLFFDGERWSASKNKSKDIEKSINNILGITSLLKMKQHLKDGSITYKTSVYSKLRRSVKGSSKEVEEISDKIDSIENRIWKKREKINENESEVELLEESIEELSKILNDNRTMESDQRELKRKKQVIDSNRKHADNYYIDFVKLFSKADKVILSSMKKDVEDLIAQVDLEGKDIPGVTSDTIDWLLKNRICLCGEQLIEGDSHYQAMLKLRSEVYPNKIGGPAKILKSKIDEMHRNSTGLIDDLRDKASMYEDTIEEIEDDERAVEKLEEKIDRKLNLEEVRRKYNRKNGQLNEIKRENTTLTYEIDELIKKKESLEKQQENILEQDKENQVIYRAIEYAEKLYSRASLSVSLREAKTLESLNEIIKENFSKMFNSQEKYAKLEDDYRMHMYYKSGGEEKNLSEGEVTAINFVYIVSILELARRQQQEEEDKDVVLSLPLVLDAPFSKLGNENISLIAQKLPQFAEQVIIFMLDKDWEASGLERYTLDEYCYRVSREFEDNNSTIKQNGGF